MSDNSKTSNLYLAAAVGFYSTFVGIAVCWALYKVWTSTQMTNILASTSIDDISIMLITLSFTMLGGMMGAVLHGLVGLHIHAVIKGEFNRRFIGSYILGPFGAAFLSLAIFCIIQGGLMALGGEVSAPDEILRASLFYIAVGVLCGFAFDTVILRIDGIAKQMFGAKKESFLENALTEAYKNTKS